MDKYNFDELGQKFAELTDKQYLAASDACFTQAELEHADYYWYQQHRDEITRGNGGPSSPALPKQIAYFLEHTTMKDENQLYIKLRMKRRAIALIENTDERYVRLIRAAEKKVEDGKKKDNADRPNRARGSKPNVRTVPNVPIASECSEVAEMSDDNYVNELKHLESLEALENATDDTIIEAASEAKEEKEMPVKTEENLTLVEKNNELLAAIPPEESLDIGGGKIVKAKYLFINQITGQLQFDAGKHGIDEQMKKKKEHDALRKRLESMSPEMRDRKMSILN